MSHDRELCAVCIADVMNNAKMFRVQAATTAGFADEYNVTAIFDEYVRSVPTRVTVMTYNREILPLYAVTTLQGTRVCARCAAARRLP